MTPPLQGQSKVLPASHRETESNPLIPQSTQQERSPNPINLTAGTKHTSAGMHAHEHTLTVALVQARFYEGVVVTPWLALCHNSKKHLNWFVISFVWCFQVFFCAITPLGTQDSSLILNTSKFTWRRDSKLFVAIKGNVCFLCWS